MINQDDFIKLRLALNDMIINLFIAKTELEQNEYIKAVGFDSKDEFIKILTENIIPVFENWRIELEKAISSTEYKNSVNFRHVLADMRNIGRNFDVDISWFTQKSNIKKSIEEIYLQSANIHWQLFGEGNA